MKFALYLIGVKLGHTSNVIFPLTFLWIGPAKLSFRADPLFSFGKNYYKSF
jgi:hypothetical protein